MNIHTPVVGAPEPAWMLQSRGEGRGENLLLYCKHYHLLPQVPGYPGILAFVQKTFNKLKPGHKCMHQTETHPSADTVLEDIASLRAQTDRHC
jgi:hypothetical protein